MAVEQDIKKFLWRNSLIVYGLTIITLGTVIGAFVYGRAVFKEARNTVYMVGVDGDVVPLIIAEQKETSIVEMKHHLVMFVDCYYNLDQSYTQKIEKAMWLGNFANDYASRKNAGYYSSLALNAKRIATLPAENIELIENEGVVTFKITIQLIEEIDNVGKNYLIFARGILKKITRDFPYNPHGYFIDKFVEEKVIEVKND